MAESSSSSSGGATGIVAIVAIVILVLIGIFAFRGGLGRGGGQAPGIKGNIEINTPSPGSGQK